MTPLQWQEAVEALFARVPLQDVVRAIDFERLIEGFEYPDDRAATRRVTFPDVMFPHVQSTDVALDKEAAEKERLRWGPKIFGLQQGRAIVPHAHNNMVSSHLVLRGRLHLRTFQRLRDDDGYIVITPSIDRVIGPGETVTMSDERDNVHWFVAESEHAFTFDVPVVDLVPGRAYPTPAQHFNMIYLDPAGARNADGSIRARVMQPEDCLRKYGKS